jgi:hypothetical protein
MFQIGSGDEMKALALQERRVRGDIPSTPWAVPKSKLSTFCILQNLSYQDRLEACVGF